ncbi:MAG: DNA-binding protein [Methylophilaceae bacterium]|nr:DNA-binding protein [Methylophilaceae bacterium]
MKTIEQVIAEFSIRGETFKAWAKKHGFKEHNVRDVLRGRTVNKFGEAHKIAVTLGIKDGEIMDERV